MYWEGWRRQDLIRFGKFLQPWQEKEQSDPKNLLFPIPNDQIAVNSNLTQNPGY
ncbi:MAG: RagB/SusD family nutrient uptake outer membrane protein [Segetibacter sp.]